jgi:hypothetical protein
VPQGHIAAGRIMSMKNLNDTIGNRSRDLPASSAVPQPTAPPAACPHIVVILIAKMAIAVSAFKTCRFLFLTPTNLRIVIFETVLTKCRWVGLP